MERTQSICCNVPSCVHHEKGDKCGLCEIKVTNNNEIQTAHYCGNYEE
ncbi:MAG: DUF1540 domain-containing protein [Bacillota bacterium]